MFRVALLCGFVASAGLFWLAAFPGAGCRITVDRNLAMLALTGGSVGALGFGLVASWRAAFRWWDERRSRAWRLPGSKGQ
jgi:hypothetical protein